MRHLNKKKSLGRESDVRKALMRSQAESLVIHESLRTTLAKAKLLRTIVEPLVTKAKKNNLASRRLVSKTLYTQKAVKKLMEVIALRYKDRQGGYTRIIKLEPRANDRAKMARIEFV